MSISISGSNLQQAMPHHVHRKHAGVSKGLEDESSALQTDTDPSDATSGGTTSSALTSFLAQLSSLDGKSGNQGTSQAAASGTATNPTAAATLSPVDQLMQTLQVFAANISPV